MKRVLITGAAGFIGSQLMARLKERDGLVVKGIDNFNKHLYSPSLKVARMKPVSYTHLTLPTILLV